MITIGGLARVIVSGNYRFRSWLRELLFSLGHQLGLVQRPLLQELPSSAGAGRTTEIRRVRVKVITTTTITTGRRALCLRTPDRGSKCADCKSKALSFHQHGFRQMSSSKVGEGGRGHRNSVCPYHGWISDYVVKG